MKRKQMGFYLIELMFLIWTIFVISVIGGAGYVAIHFISKFW